MLPSPGNLIFGLIGIIIGFFFMTRAYYMQHQIYFLSWPEQKWGPGSGTMVYRFGGLALMLFSIFVLTGWIDLFGSGQEAATTVEPTNPIPRPNTGVQIAP